MGASTGISWCDSTFNLAWGCEKISPGCLNCYAEVVADKGTTAFRQNGQPVGVWGKGRPRRTFGEKYWRQPVNWNAQANGEKRRHKVFCSSMTDVFLDDPTIGAEREKLWPMIRQTPCLDWMLLTKRADRIASCLPPDWSPENYPNVWLGVSVENAEYAWRVVPLSKIPAVVRFVSYEPAIGPLDTMDLTGIDLVIYGGESGPGFRPEDKGWAQSMHERCYSAGVTFFHKQSAAFRTGSGIELHGQVVQQFPNPRYPAGVRVPFFTERTEPLIAPAKRPVATSEAVQSVLF
jgi:protein gp37